MPERITRRTALKLPAALAGGAALAGIPVPGQAAQVSPIVNYDDLAAVARDARDEYEQASADRLATYTALEATLNPEQRRLLLKLDDQAVAQQMAVADTYVAELARHFPGLAPALLMTWEHCLQIDLAKVGRCCTAAEGYEA